MSDIKTDFKSVLHRGTVSYLVGVHFNFVFNYFELPDFETSLLDMAELCTREKNELQTFSGILNCNHMSIFKYV